MIDQQGVRKTVWRLSLIALGYVYGTDKTTQPHPHSLGKSVRLVAGSNNQSRLPCGSNYAVIDDSDIADGIIFYRPDKTLTGNRNIPEPRRDCTGKFCLIRFSGKIVQFINLNAL